jgi:hypothetical protein
MNAKKNSKKQKKPYYPLIGDVCYLNSDKKEDDFFENHFLTFLFLLDYDQLCTSFVKTKKKKNKNSFGYTPK